MAYIGPPPTQKLATPTSQYFSGNGSATAFTLNRPVNVAEDLNVFVNNVPQQPGAGKSYTATGTTLTFDAAPDAGTNNVYVVYRGLAEPTTRLEHPSGQPIVATAGTFSGALTATAGASSNAVSLQSANFKVTDLTANAFYRTDTFTPNFSTTAATDQDATVFNAYTHQKGFYTRIGNLVYAQVDVKLAASFGFVNGGASGQVWTVVNFPFKFKNDANQFSNISCGWFDNWDSWGTGYTPMGYGVPNTKRVQMTYAGTNGAGYSGTEYINVSNAHIRFDITYETDEA
tara:strand:+ start:1642 stop:2502 length:861 start_codon:yes stop_codon:yes gene_type:complete